MNMEEQNPAAIKVLFLDMDGVLTRGATMQSRNVTATITGGRIRQTGLIYTMSIRNLRLGFQNLYRISTCLLYLQPRGESERPWMTSKRD